MNTNTQLLKKNMSFNLFESSKFLENVYIFVFPPIGALAFIGNLISYIIFSTPRFAKKPLYIYLRVSCLNNMIVNFIISFNFIWISNLFSSGLSNTRWQVSAQCYVKYPIIMSAYSFGGFLDIVLALERLCELTNSRHKFHQFNPIRVCIVVLILSLILNMPIILMCEPKSGFLFNSQTNKSEEIFFMGASEFTWSRVGFISLFVRFLIRDILSLVLLIALNISAFIMFRRKYMRLNLKTRVVDNPPRISYPNSNRINRNHKLYRKNLTSFRAHIQLTNKMLTKMIFFICSITTIQHLFLLTCILLIKFFFYPIKSFFLFTAYFSLLLKHSVDFFIFYNYNSLFRSRFRRMIRNIIKI